ncbi:helix-turn-helix domain-containing protein [Vibrio sp.]|nr:helix-turn-helix domain-containing protein [Vibrio sp.]
MSKNDSKYQNEDAAPASSESVRDTIARLRANQAYSNITKTRFSSPEKRLDTQIKNGAQRASKKRQPITASERQHRISEVTYALLRGELTQGLALKTLRVKVLGMKQDAFAKMVNVSRKTISDIENDRGSFKTEILNNVFKPFGLKVGLIPISASLLNSALSEKTSS